MAYPLKNSESKILVTGASGFLGSKILLELLARGYKCTALDILEPEVALPSVDYHVGDIRDYSLVFRACHDIKIVFHNVAKVPLTKNSKEMLTVNVDGTRNILEASLNHQVQKIVYTSSSAVYGIPLRNPVLESHPTKPFEDYGRAKLGGELMCQEFLMKGLDIAIVRPRTIIGRGRLGIFQTLFEWIYEGRKIPVLGDGSNFYQFVHSDDVVDACIRAGNQVGSGIYCCGADQFGTMRELLEDLCAYANTGSRVVGIPRKLTMLLMEFANKMSISPLGSYHAEMYGRSIFFENKKAREELNWKPKYSNKEMFLEAYDWYVENRLSILQGENSASPHNSSVKQGVLDLVKKFF